MGIHKFYLQLPKFLYFQLSPIQMPGTNFGQLLAARVQFERLIEREIALLQLRNDLFKLFEGLLKRQVLKVFEGNICCG